MFLTPFKTKNKKTPLDAWTDRCTSPQNNAEAKNVSKAQEAMENWAVVRYPLKYSTVHYNSDRMLINGTVSEKSRKDDKCLEDKPHKENLEETGCFAQ